MLRLAFSNLAELKTGILIVEHHHKKELREELGELSRYRVLKQGDSALSFYKVG